MENKKIELKKEDLLKMTTEELIELFKKIEETKSYLRACILDVDGESDDE